MTLTSDLAKLGTYDPTDISNIVARVYPLLSLYYQSTLTEGLDSDWDVIAEFYAIYLLDRLVPQRKASKEDSSVTVPPLMSKEVKEMINALDIESDMDEDIYVATYAFPTDDP